MEYTFFKLICNLKITYCFYKKLDVLDLMYYNKNVIEFAGMAKQADARDLKSLGVTSVPVQVRLPALSMNDEQ